MLQLHVGVLLLETFDISEWLGAGVAQKVVVLAANPSWSSCHSPELFLPLFTTPLLTFGDLGLQD